MLSRIAAALALVLVTQGKGVALGRDNGPEEIPSPISRVYVPVGFDDNDATEIVMHGKYRNTCFKVSRAGARVDRENHMIIVWGTTLHYKGVGCAQLVTPFVQVVNVGVLPAGEYKVVVDSNPSLIEKLDIARRLTDAPDNELYAPVDTAELTGEARARDQALLLRGRFPYMPGACMSMKEVRVSRYPNGMFVILPIAQIKQGSPCTHFDYSVSTPLAEPFRGEGLLHVRSLNGASINRFVIVPD